MPALSLVRQAALAALLFVDFVPPLFAKGPWVVLEDCRFVANEANDADSFHVTAAGKEYIFRLYFVDAPETDASFPARVAEQAKYFELTTAQTLQLGDFARRFAKEKLTPPFTLRTCMQHALGRSRKERFYAFIGTSEGDLGELLVANGMARVHGNSATPAGLNSPEREWQKLQRLEREAKQEKVGAWGATFGRLTARLPAPPPKSGPDSFDAFFHPKKLAATAEADQILAPASASGSPWPVAAAMTETKLDPNTATLAELLAIEGIGPVLASRIIAARPFKNAEGLRSIPGIGPKKYEKLRPYFNAGLTSAVPGP